MSNPIPSPGNRPLDQLKVAELRDELRKRGLSLKGVKKELFERLDEAVRKEQAGIVGDKEAEGGSSSNLPPLDNEVETTQDNDGMSYLNDVESTQDTTLIVNNASPYVGASDASPVFMEPRKDVERLPVMTEESKDDASVGDGSSLPYSGNRETAVDKVMSQPDNISNAENAVPEADNQVVENEVEHANEGSLAGTLGLESGGKLASEADTTLPAIGSQDLVLPSPEGGISNVNIAAPELGSTNDIVVSEPVDAPLLTPLGNDIDAGEGAASAQVVTDAEVASISDVVIPIEGDKDVPSASVSDDILNAADTRVDTVVNASDSPMQDVEVFERTVLTSVSVVTCVQEFGKEPDGGALKVGIVEKANEELGEEDSEKGKLQKGGEALEAIVATPEVPMFEAGQELQVPEFKEMHDITVQEPVPDAAVQEEMQDVEMPDIQENMLAKVEALEMLPPAAASEAIELPVEIKLENVDNVGDVDTGLLTEASRAGAVDERKLDFNSEPKEAESWVTRRAVPVEIVKVEQKEIKEEPAKSGRSVDRLRPRDYESYRPRHNSNREFDERGRSGRYFKEEGRKDTKETISRPEEGSDVRAGLKRKDDDPDAKQQEPAKRVRRWNSGNAPVIDIARPLTSGTVNEIVSPEVKKEDFPVAAPKFTPKPSGPIRPIPSASKPGLEPNGERRPVPPSARPPSASLKIERFVRPFTLKAVKDLLAEFGECVDFWMDQIKTHCFVTYSKVDEAVAARNGLYDRQWPPSFGNLLVADFVDASEVKMRSDGTFEKMNAAPASTTPRGFPNQPPALGPQHTQPNALASAPPLRERQYMQALVKEPEPPVPTLDDLFRKTKAKPHIYYLPLTDEQVAEKLAAAKSKEQLPARGRLVARG